MVFEDEIFLIQNLRLGWRPFFQALKNIKFRVEIKSPLVPLSSETKTKDLFKLAPGTKSFPGCSFIPHQPYKWLNIYVPRSLWLNINFQPVHYEIFKGWWVWSVQLSAQSNQSPVKARTLDDEAGACRQVDKRVCRVHSDSDTPGYTELRLCTPTLGCPVCEWWFTNTNLLCYHSQMVTLRPREVEGITPDFRVSEEHHWLSFSLLSLPHKEWKKNFFFLPRKEWKKNSYAVFVSVRNHWL